VELITLDATALARIAGTVRGAANLIELDFLSGLQRATNWSQTVVSGGNTYLGLGDIISISPMGESEDTKNDKVTISISIVNSAMLAALIGPATEYRGRAVRLYLQLFDDGFQPAGASVLRWAGKMDKVAVVRKRAGLDGTPTGKIELQCSRSGVARMRNDDGLRLTHAQQLQRFPGDNGLEYLDMLVAKPATWLSTKFQKI